MVDQVVIGFNDPHSAYHSADSIPPGGEDGIRVACSGGIGGAGAPHCAPGRVTRTAPRATFPRYSRVYVSAPPTARRIPQVDVTGIEPATACLQSPGLSTFDHTLRFFSGWGIGDPVVGGRTPFAGLVPAVLGVHAPSRHS